MFENADETDTKRVWDGGSIEEGKWKRVEGEGREGGRQRDRETERGKRKDGLGNRMKWV